MNYRVVGKTALNVSEIGFSLQSLAAGLGRRITEGEAMRLLYLAFDLGINFFETADTYGFGSSEELLARAFPRSHRDQIRITTQVGYDPESRSARLRGELTQDFSPPHLTRSTETALKRLRTDRIDFLFLHHLTHDAVRDNAVWETLAQLRSQGKILHWGASLGPKPGWLYEGIECVQQREPALLDHDYNLLQSFPGRGIFAAAYSRLPHPEATVEELPLFRHGLMPAAPQLETRFVIRNPLHEGLLEGRFTDKTVFAPTDPRFTKPSRWLERGLKKAALLSFLTGRETGRTLAQGALLWVLAEASVATCLPNISNEIDLREYAAASEKNPLTPGELERVADLMEGPLGTFHEEPGYAGTMRRSGP